MHNFDVFRSDKLAAVRVVRYGNFIALLAVIVHSGLFRAPGHGNARRRDAGKA